MRTLHVLALFLLLPAGLRAQVILPLLVDGRSVSEVHYAFEDKSDDTVWFATSAGLFYTSGGNTLSERPAKDSIRRDLRHVARVDNEIWVGGEGGVYKIDDEYERIDTGLSSELTVYTILTEGTSKNETLWLATSEGVFQRRTGSNFALKLAEDCTFLGFADHGKTQPQGLIENQDQVLWASNRNGLFQFNRGNHRFEKFTGHAIANISKIFSDKYGQVYLWTNDTTEGSPRGKAGTSLYEHPSGERVESTTMKPLDAEIVGGLLWYTADQTIRFKSPTGVKKKELCNEIIEAIKAIEESQKYLWLVHRYGILRFSKFENPECKTLTTNTSRHEWDISSVLETKTGLFLYGASGIYRLWENIDIKLKIGKQDFGVINRYFVSESNYFNAKSGTEWAPPRGLTEHFSAIIATSDKSFRREMKDPENRFVSVYDWSYLGYLDSYYISVHDHYGNTRQVAPSRATTVLSVPLMWLFVFLVYTVSPAFLVLLLFRWLPFKLRYILYSISASVLAPNPLRPLLLLSTLRMRRRFRDIYADFWLVKSGMCTEVPENIMRRIETSKEIFLTSQERGQMKLEDIACDICKRSGKDFLRDSIPLVHDFHQSDVKSSGDIRREMNTLLGEAFSWFSFVGSGFSSQLLIKGDFVFLFYYDETNKELKNAACDFAASYPGRRLVMSAVPVAVEPEPSRDIGIKSVWGRMKGLFS